MRHHGIYLDRARLFANPVFTARCKDELKRNVKPPDLVLVPKNVNSEHVCTLVKQVFPGARADIIPDRQFGAELATKFIESRSLLLADDRIATGTPVFG